MGGKRRKYVLEYEKDGENIMVYRVSHLDDKEKIERELSLLPQ